MVNLKAIVYAYLREDLWRHLYNMYFAIYYFITLYKIQKQGKINSRPNSLRRYMWHVRGWITIVGRYPRLAGPSADQTARIGRRWLLVRFIGAMVYWSLITEKGRHGISGEGRPFLVHDGWLLATRIAHVRPVFELLG